MSFGQLILRLVTYLLIIPAMCAVGVIWSAVVMSLAVLLSPVACVVSLFAKSPYMFLGSFYELALYLSGILFEAVLDILEELA